MAYTTIDKPNQYFNTKLYTGTGSTQSITGVGFQPDFTWIKQRDGATARHHRLVDSVRGATKYLESDRNIAEVTDSNQVTSLDSDGFTVGTGNATNSNTVNFASWNWLAGGTASSNTDGSITSQVSANTISGFSIGTYTGNSTSDATIGHGLSLAPEMIIVKNRDGLDNWQVYWNTGTERNGFLNLTNAFNTPASTAQWGTNVPTSSVFYVGNDSATNTSNNYLFYAFHSVKGYSKFGEYTGNGSTDGTFVYTGFKPAWVMIKRTDSTGGWIMLDNKRDIDNPEENYLIANVSNAETTDINLKLDALSNGFKLRANSSATNASGGTHIYMAFAENPFVTSTGVPTTAR